MVMHKLRTIPAAARLSGISKSELYEGAGAGRLKVSRLGSSKPQMRTALEWVMQEIDALPSL